jgi:plasmid stabilization system protein ParE
MRQISFHHLAERELSDASRFYEFESPGLGAAFLDAVEKTCISILEHPDSGVTVLGHIRRRLIRRFPYALLYSIRSDRVRVLAVMNLKRRPMYWVGRD